jgi:hypothetical protein
MSTWPNRGASGGPCGGLEERKSEPNTVKPTRFDSSQQASSKPGAVQPAFDCPLQQLVGRHLLAAGAAG